MARCTRGERRRATCDECHIRGQVVSIPPDGCGLKGGTVREELDTAAITAGPPAVGTRTNVLAILALALGILVGAGSVPALVLGYIARRQIDRSGGRQTGRRLAVAAIVLGWVGVGVLVVSFAFGFAAGADGS